MARVDKARFARLAVNIDLTKLLVFMVKLDGVTQIVEYESLPTICYHCGRYGLLEVSSPTKHGQQKMTEPTTTSLKQAAVQTEHAAFDQEPKAREVVERDNHIFGPWMQVPSRAWQNRKGYKRPSNNVASKNDRGGNRFKVLHSADEEDNHHSSNPGKEARKANTLSQEMVIPKRHRGRKGWKRQPLERKR
ncbi:uncharacterized protein LOC114730449 [Neltuma alba]|uniref:uncharacterized protein LOC114730449 n=1 Tax=Neltuma alba TaxID=207710 RepID=UPI0010A4110E|nr:uncharacterized protein LOC114730449 [Prosopis alba]